jgi:hypothetical protein
MKARSRRRLAALIMLTLGVGAVPLDGAPLRALDGDHDVAFPDRFADGVLYAIIDRADLKQYRELYAPASAIAAIKAGKPLPLGTVLTMVAYAAKLDSTGKPLTDAKGRLARDALVAFLVMEKRPDGEARRSSSGTGDGKWRFQIFGADKRIDKNAKLTDCAECHQKRRDHDFVFTGDQMKSVAPEVPAR